MRTVIDIDKELLEVARHELGTSTTEETVNAALKEISERSKRRKAFEYWRARDNADLLDPDTTNRAWYPRA
ncbi:type II toxin-antitoxin system VapB family antitoxin [Nonomuraea turcica]|uniref:type II toxin-antitoxin system VapB family antitoxin n=1 Tax=Nonomuraea sp. G32 TaxID=3067274 RepID=UPI00273C26D4|nr:type II toxin-antitoxin system VapB family antitoxin [Nonomuraea sp. G32]MDP4506484.1 type II toxin-antitoxin system VapB family antitoxin [Nonomuraea sp. G32]